MMHDYCLQTPSAPTKMSSAVQCNVMTESKSTQTTLFTKTFKHVGINTFKIVTFKHCSSQTDLVDSVNADTQTKRPTLVYEDLKNKEKKLNFYTGIQSAAAFEIIFDELSTNEKELKKHVGKRKELRWIDEFFLVLMRLRLGLLLCDLADRFCISISTCGNLFERWTVFLYVNFSQLVQWPTREQIRATMPHSFVHHFPRCRVIVDCTELFTRTPASLISQSLAYSHYKSNMTWKALIGITPNGVLSFVSDLWLGSISDQQIVLKSGLLDLLEKGDAILADKGFDMAKHTAERGIELIIPPKKKKANQMLARDIILTRRIASLRIHVERYMARVKKFRILNNVLSTTTKANEIWHVCNALTMFMPPLNPRK